MKKFILFIFLIGLFYSPASSFAQNNPARKLIRGLVNIPTSILEIPKQTRLYWKKGGEISPHILVWVFSGLVKGTVDMVARIGSGLWDILTFPMAIPENYEPLKRPDTVFEKDKLLGILER